ncbi:MAG TPA: divalent metal cation transporter [Candidatus Paceibacterota bacterium]|nr:divalent metal cation transporter [Candidatus Paceibacterota bacterium]
MRKRLTKFWKALGPGLTTGAAGNDPSAIATYSLAGGRFAYGLSWMVVFLTPFMIAIQNMCARIGALSGCGLAGNLKRHYPSWVLGITVVTVVFTSVLNVAANLYGMAGALNLVIPLSVPVLSVVTAGLVIVLVIKLRYRTIAAIFKWFALSLFVYLVAAVTVGQDWPELLRRALVPGIPWNRDGLLMMFAVLGTTLSPYLFFWQASEEAEVTRQERPGLRICKFREVPRGVLAQIDTDTKLGMIFSNTIAFFIIALAATTLYGAGAHGIESLRDAASALEPIAGRYAFLLFSVGLVGSGLLAIPVLAGGGAYVLSESFGWGASIDHPFSKARNFYVVMVLAILSSVLVPLLGISPIQALFWVAIINAAVAPLLLMLIIQMANNPKIVGEHTSAPSVHWLGVGAMFIMLTGSFVVLFS